MKAVQPSREISGAIGTHHVIRQALRHGLYHGEHVDVTGHLTSSCIGTTVGAKGVSHGVRPVAPRARRRRGLGGQRRGPCRHARARRNCCAVNAVKLLGVRMDMHQPGTRCAHGYQGVTAAGSLPHTRTNHKQGIGLSHGRGQTRTNA